MKTRILKAVFPIVAFVFAITAAFAFTPVKDDAATNFSGHRKVGTQCVDALVQCTDVNTTVICQDASNNTLYRFLGPTNCPNQLWKIMP